MTAQVGVLNKRAVALASDSAVTITRRDKSGVRHKVNHPVNKLFNLSEQHSVGIMIFGSINFVGIPLENLIEMYKKRLGSRKFNTFKEYVGDFEEFIKNGFPLPTSEQQESLLRKRVRAWFMSIDDDMRASDYDEVLDGDEKQAKLFAKKFIHKYWSEITQHAYVESSTEDQRRAFLSQYGLMIKIEAQSFFGEFLLDDKSMQELCEIILGMIFRRIVPDKDMSGIVIAGFGEEEVFPSLYKFGIEGIGAGKIKVQEGEPTIISDKHNAAIVPFAQDEMVYLFMEGIDEDLQEYALNVVNNSIQKLLIKLVTPYLPKDRKKRAEFLKKKDVVVEDILNDYLKSIHIYKQNYHVQPVLKMIGSLPEKELAILAQSLVDLTISKRRVSMDPGTVGGDIDVALITKSGFEWFAGKHCS